MTCPWIPLLWIPLLVLPEMCLCETKYQGGGIAPSWGSANLPEKVSRDMGYRSDSIAVSRDMGPPPHFVSRCFSRGIGAGGLLEHSHFGGALNPYILNANVFQRASPSRRHLRDGPTTTTTIFEFISRGSIFRFWGTPR